MARSLTESNRQVLYQKTLELLRTSDLDAPEADEGETNYTRRCLAPLLQEYVESLRFNGLIAQGSGGPSVFSCHLLDLNFYPDLTIVFFGDPILAVEVKYLKRGQRQNAFATAIGQSVIYRQRFERSVALVIDKETRSSIGSESLAKAITQLEDVGVGLVYRQITTQGILAPAP